MNDIVRLELIIRKVGNIGTKCTVIVYGEGALREESAGKANTIVEGSTWTAKYVKRGNNADLFTQTRVTNTRLRNFT